MHNVVLTPVLAIAYYYSKTSEYNPDGDNFHFISCNTTHITPGCQCKGCTEEGASEVVSNPRGRSHPTLGWQLMDIPRP